MKIIDYKVVAVMNNLLRQDATSIAKEVMSEIEDGWTPFGGIAYAEGRLFQAMVKYEEKKETE